MFPTAPRPSPLLPRHSMSWVTVIWSMTASACLTLAAIYFLVWCQRRTVSASLLFSLTSAATAVFAGCELSMMRAETPVQFATALRWLMFQPGCSSFRWSASSGSTCARGGAGSAGPSASCELSHCCSISWWGKISTTARSPPRQKLSATNRLCALPDWRGCFFPPRPPF